MERYPENTQVGPEDFRRSGWKEILTSTTRDGYSDMWQVFSSAARQAIEGKKTAEGKVLWLLADACSMMLNPASVNEPFKPIMVMDGKRSVLPEDFQEVDVKLFSQIAEEIDDVWLRARLADLVWLLQRPRDPNLPCWQLTHTERFRLMQTTGFEVVESAGIDPFGLPSCLGKEQEIE